MASPPIERLNYYPTQYLGAKDFIAQQTYHRDMRRRHNVGHHVWGIVVGLELTERPLAGGGVEIVVQPGMAIDGYGREIVVPERVLLDPADFSSFANNQTREVWIAYSESLTLRPKRGYESCEGDDSYGRVQETYRFVIEPVPPTHDEVIVGGNPVLPPPPVNPDDLTIPADESVPYQTLPDDATMPRWLVRLGSVQWNGIADQFETTPIETRNRERRYIGAVAADLYTPETDLRLRPRAIPDTAANDAFTVSLHGGKLRFRDHAGSDAGVPLWAHRTFDAVTGVTDLHIRLGETNLGLPAGATTRFTVGPKSADGKAEGVVLAVKADDTVDIPTGSLNIPLGPINFGAKLRQMLNLWSNGAAYPYGIGVQAATLYLRTDDEFCWFRDGVHSDAQSNPGAGGLLQMKLDANAVLSLPTGSVEIPVGELRFGSQTRQMIRLWGTVYGIGVQDYTLYQRTDADFCWFRDGTHSDTRSAPGFGGVLAMKLDEASNLFVTNGITTGGDVLVGTGVSRAVKTRHVNGKDFGSDADGDLFLNWRTGRAVVIGEEFGIASNLTVSGSATVRGAATVSGNLTVSGTNNLIRVRTYTRAVQNAGQDTPANVVINYAGDFPNEVYGGFVVFQGYSLWNNSGNTAFNNWGHVEGGNVVPQHVYARITAGPTATSATVQIYCSESDAGLEGDNSVLFTLVVIGR